MTGGLGDNPFFVILSEAKDLCSKVMNQYYVYIMTNPSRTLYTGVTNNLEIRAWQHKSGKIPGFTSKYKINRLVYFETTQDVIAAIDREKQKGLVA